MIVPVLRSWSTSFSKVPLPLHFITDAITRDENSHTADFEMIFYSSFSTIRYMQTTPPPPHTSQQRVCQAHLGATQMQSMLPDCCPHIHPACPAPRPQPLSLLTTIPETVTCGRDCVSPVPGGLTLLAAAGWAGSDRGRL